MHHIGFVAPSIQQSAESFALSFGATWDGNVVLDRPESPRVTFFQGRKPADPLIELVEPGGAESPVWRFLKRGGGRYHLC